MKLQPAADFLKWASQRSIAIDAEYARNWPRNLTFTTTAPDRRFWDYPEGARDAAYFLHDALTAIGDWSHIAIWPKSESWIEEIFRIQFFDADSPRKPLPDALLAPFQQLSESDGAIILERSELGHIIAAMFAALTFGGIAATDIYLVPDIGDMIFMTDHHDVLWAEFANSERCIEYVAELRKRGWPLPDDYPDETFKQQPWLNPPNSP